MKSGPPRLRAQGPIPGQMFGTAHSGRGDHTGGPFKGQTGLRIFLLTFRRKSPPESRLARQHHQGSCHCARICRLKMPSLPVLPSFSQQFPSFTRREIPGGRDPFAESFRSLTPMERDEFHQLWLRTGLATRSGVFWVARQFPYNRYPGQKPKNRYRFTHRHDRCQTKKKDKCQKPLRPFWLGDPFLPPLSHPQLP